MNNLNKVILTDCDGVLMNWEYAMNVWMQSQGYKIVEGGQEHYDMGDRYNLDPELKSRLVRQFNESAAIGFLPPLRDAMYYVDLLHRKHGYVFHMITSLSLDPFLKIYVLKILKNYLAKQLLSVLSLLTLVQIRMRF